MHVINARLLESGTSSVNTFIVKLSLSTLIFLVLFFTVLLTLMFFSPSASVFSVYDVVHWIESLPYFNWQRFV